MAEGARGGRAAVGAVSEAPSSLPDDLAERPDVRAFECNGPAIAERCQAGIADELFDAQVATPWASVALVALVAMPENLRDELYAATEATEATKADSRGFQLSRYLRPNRHYVAIHRVTGRPAVFT
jgi:hypothetical protein